MWKSLTLITVRYHNSATMNLPFCLAGIFMQNLSSERSACWEQCWEASFLVLIRHMIFLQQILLKSTLYATLPSIIIPVLVNTIVNKFVCFRNWRQGLCLGDHPVQLSITNSVTTTVAPVVGRYSKLPNCSLHLCEYPGARTWPRYSPFYYGCHQCLVLLKIKLRKGLCNVSCKLQTETSTSNLSY